MSSRDTEMGLLSSWHWKTVIAHAEDFRTEQFFGVDCDFNDEEYLVAFRKSETTLVLAGYHTKLRGPFDSSEKEVALKFENTEILEASSYLHRKNTRVCVHLLSLEV